MAGAGGSQSGGADADLVSRDRQLTLALSLRRPAVFHASASNAGVVEWTGAVKVNGQAQAADSKPGQWATVNREWRPGDTVEITGIPATIHRVPGRASSIPNRVAIAHGPVVYGRGRSAPVAIRSLRVAMTNWIS